MLLAPFGVFALMAGTITEITGDNPAGILELLAALGIYCATVLFGLGVHMIVTYGLILRFLTPISIGTFYRAMVPAQLLAFSTSSSAASCDSVGAGPGLKSSKGKKMRSGSSMKFVTATL